MEKPGIYVEHQFERNYYGDVINISRRWQNGTGLNDNLEIQNKISIVADPFAYENMYSMRYIEWLGSLWKITDVSVESPRLILSIGGLYNAKP